MSEVRILRDVYSQEAFDKEFIFVPDKRSLWEKVRRKAVARVRHCTPLKVLHTLLPVTVWLPQYRWSFLSNDLIAGSTVAILNIPQAMAYAALAGVPAIIGLYTSFLPALLYLFLGTSKHISLGMFAVVALMTGTTEQRLRSNETGVGGVVGDLGAQESVQIIAALTLAVGLVLAVMALCQVHFVSDYLSDQLIGGFTTGAACHVMWSQIPKIFALRLPQKSGIFKLFKIMIVFFEHIGNTNVTSLILSACCIVLLFLGKLYVNPFVARFCPVPIPLELLVVIGTTVLSSQLQWHQKHNLSVVGKIPTGFSAPQLPHLSRLPEVFPDAIVIAVVIYAVSFSVAKLFAKRHRYKLNAAQEIRALATVQILSSFMLCHPGCASLSRSTINSQLGVRSQLSALVSSGIILLLILWIGPLVEQLPMCVLASIIVVALKPMFMQLTQLKRLWTTSTVDFAIFLVSFLATALWDVSEGLVIALLFALLTVVLRVQCVGGSEEGCVGESELYRNVRHYIKAHAPPTAVVFRFERALLFVNCDRFKAKSMQMFHFSIAENQSQNELESTKKPFFVLDASAISEMDVMGSEALLEVAQEVARKEVGLLVAGARPSVVHTWRRCVGGGGGGSGKVAESVRFFASVHDALLFAQMSCGKRLSLIEP